MAKPLDLVAGGWQLNGTVSIQSGVPLGFDDVILHGTINQIQIRADKRTVDQWFHASVFERAPANQLAYDIRTFP